MAVLQVSKFKKGMFSMRHVPSSMLAMFLAAAFSAMPAMAAMAADYPAPKQGDFIAHDFKFHGGEVMAELKLHYTTVGAPSGQPVLVLHGSGGSKLNSVLMLRHILISLKHCLE